MLKVSFVIPAHNAAAWLGHAVQSCLEQTYKNCEIVIVNDGSTDSTEDYLKWLESQNPKNVVIVRHATPKGRSAARNAGNAAASGDVIAVLDADDLALPNRAQITAQRFNCGAQFVYGSAYVMDAVGRKLTEVIAQPFDKIRALEEQVNSIVHSTTAYTKKLAMRFPYRDGEPARLGVDDWLQQTEMLFAGIKFTHISEHIAAYRVLEGSVSNTRNEEEVKRFKQATLEALRIPV